METKTKRMLLFLIGCIGTRLFITYIAKQIKNEYLPYLGYIALLPAIGFMYIYLTNGRQTGPEVFGDKIWWNDLRPIHSINYFIFAYYAIHQYKNAWIFLFIDVMFGIVMFLQHHFKLMQSK